MAVSARISKSGQVTIPAEIRETLGVRPGDSVIWRVDDQGHVAVERVKYTLDDMDGILGPLPDGMTLDEVISEATGEAIDRRLGRWREKES